ncbi:hypothetical protein AB0I39_19420 [Kitasatospora purpeofusca]|uniref:hypothetical protein n=1 Tax=Kitasatospora purpeofusca TaxID=67352 RepID=UPI00340D1F76
MERLPAAPATVSRSIAVGHDARATAALAELRALVPLVRLPVLEFYPTSLQTVLDWQAGRRGDAERGPAAFRERCPRSRLGSGGLPAAVRGPSAAVDGRTARAATRVRRRPRRWTAPALARRGGRPGPAAPGP